ncbi:hypothetical protein PHLH6_15900 [Pseudomonas sp. Seg1]|nr:hypothetical protein PHLH6_15900 [Pseudomonas sp. Seg1]
MINGRVSARSLYPQVMFFSGFKGSLYPAGFCRL